jgi:hypothetical protein
VVFVEGDDYRQLRRPGDDPAQFRSVVRPVQVPAAPDSVLHRYRGENFTTSTWTDSVGNADMSINGVSASTLNGDRAASSDGVDDLGLADGPQVVAENPQFALSFVYRGTDSQDFTDWLFSEDSQSLLGLNDTDAFDNSTGELLFDMRDSNGNRISVESSPAITDGNIHLIVINCDSTQGASGVDVYIDDMDSPVSDTHINDSGFKASQYSNSVPMGFFCRNVGGSKKAFKSYETSFIEFNGGLYSQQDRLNLKQRAPGL